MVIENEKKKFAHEWNFWDLEKDFMCTIFPSKLLKRERKRRNEMRKGFFLALGLRNGLKLERKNNISWCHPTIVKSLSLSLSVCATWIKINIDYFIYFMCCSISFSTVFFFLFFFLTWKIVLCALWSKRWMYGVCLWVREEFF